eukprot:TRINITY_DN12101_c0_g1_i1.p1 TRINITY_DN12101_c0_g1~~TRINITY_DN12101_c0_g1_i1.p1  ORF type:complete len:185 (+),score=21.34 TRINITY_DN12101_c0_g1_i1:16-570(+)
MSWSWKSNLRLGDSDESAWTPYAVADMTTLETAWTTGSKEKPITLNGFYSVDLQRMLQIRKDDPSRQRPIRRLDVATQNGPRVKVTKRKADSETDSTRSNPKRSKILEKPQPEATKATGGSIFHTVDHIVLRDWVYDDTGSNKNGLDEEMKVESSPAFSRLKLDLDQKFAPDLVEPTKKSNVDQ